MRNKLWLVLSAVFCLLPAFAFGDGGPANADEKPMLRAAIFVQNRAGEEFRDKLDVLNDLITTRLTEKGFSIIDGDAAIRKSLRQLEAAAGKSGADVEEAITGASALRIAQMIGADYIIVATINPMGKETKSFSGYGTRTQNNILYLRIALKVLEGNQGRSVYGDTVIVSERVSAGENLSVETSEIVPRLLDAGAQRIAENVSSKVERIRNVQVKSVPTVEVTVQSNVEGAAVELSQGERDTIFIGELQVKPSVIEAAKRQGRGLELNRALESLDTQFISALNGTRVFQLVERKRFSDLKLEQDFAQSGNVDESDSRAAQAGKMTGARFAFLPVVDAFEDSAETAEYQKIGRADLNRKLFLSATVQVIDTTSGKVLSDSPSVQLAREEVVEGGRPGQVRGSEQALVALAKDTAQKLSRELVGLLRPAKVLAVTGKQIMINRGSEAGFGTGDLVEIYATQDVKDDDTGEVYRNEVPVGQAIVDRLDKKQSFARLSGDDMGIAKGCIVRPIKAKPVKSEPVADEPLTPGSGDKPLKW